MEVFAASENVNKHEATMNQIGYFCFVYFRAE